MTIASEEPETAPRAAAAFLTFSLVALRLIAVCIWSKGTRWILGIGVAGIEPATSWSQTRHATAALHPATERTGTDPT